MNLANQSKGSTLCINQEYFQSAPCAGPAGAWLAGHHRALLDLDHRRLEGNLCPFPPTRKIVKTGVAPCPPTMEKNSQWPASGKDRIFSEASNLIAGMARAAEGRRTPRRFAFSVESRNDGERLGSGAMYLAANWPLAPPEPFVTLRRDERGHT